ncbi:MAG: aminoacyl-tRNA deacylase [Acidimicrobiia bacterium]|nr:aminoacyl-tRNA deacylase [Acidimicrobiia bacterium]
MAKARIPSTPAVRELRRLGVAFEPYLYDYEPGGGTGQFADLFDVDEHAVIKTLVLEDDGGTPSVVLMHGDREVSLKSVARVRGVKRCGMCPPDHARRHTGYLVGGTSPFGTRKQLPILAHDTIADLDRCWVNGGSRGFIVGVSAADLVGSLGVELADVAT